eukprot:TRINITY_DN26069_c0_g1_i1.p1 TRINITY_DN26069_c0_g1~~TRINITY_DN26069_c0_g1_i1.p1  ORF type:complete len:545 (-),score=66.57 TRINITY_DN26069_c0_g1_i1:47-1681(-)
MAPFPKRLIAPILEASLLRRSVDYLAKRARPSVCIDPKERGCDALGVYPTDLRVSAATFTVFVSYDEGVEAMEFSKADEGPPKKVSAIGVVPPSSPLPEAFLLFVETVAAWIAADVTFDKDAQIKILTPDARCFGEVGNEKIADGNMKLSKTIQFAMPYPIVLHFDQRIFSWDFDIVDRSSQEVSGRGTDVVHVTTSGKVEKVDTVRHLVHQPSWVKKQFVGDPLAELEVTRAADSVLPVCPSIPPSSVLVPRPASQVPIYRPYDGIEMRSANVRHPSVCGSSVPAYAFGSDVAERTVIVMSEWWGIDSGILDIARSLASALGPGTRTVVPNFYRDQSVPIDVDWGIDDVNQHGITEAAFKMSNVNWTEVITDVEAIVAASSGPVALMGFSFGACATLLAAQHVTNNSSKLSCAVAWYGLPDDRFTGGAAKLFDPSNVRVPVQLQWGTEDKVSGFSDLAAGEKLASMLMDVEFNKYTGDHGFFNDRAWWETWKASLKPTPRPPFSPEVATESWAKTVDFLKKHLDNAAATQSQNRGGEDQAITS